MKSSSEVIRGAVEGTFVDKDCTIEIDGKKFTSGGAFIGYDEKTGKMGGRVYVNQKKREVGNWDGSIKVNCFFGKEWRSNFGDRRLSVYFQYAGRYFYGMLCQADWNELVAVREIKPWI
jgi:hypothetical protein